MTPDELVAALIERFEHDDQIAFWGEGIVENVRRQMVATEGSQRHMSEDEFFAELGC